MHVLWSGKAMGIPYMFLHAKSVSFCRSCNRCASGYVLGIISAFRRTCFVQTSGY